MPHREFDLAVGELPPVLDNRHVAALRKTIEDFTGLPASRVNRQGEGLRLLQAGQPVGQILWARKQVVTPLSCLDAANLESPAAELKTGL
jgi:hypothetical protein